MVAGLSRSSRPASGGRLRGRYQGAAMAGFGVDSRRHRDSDLFGVLRPKFFGYWRQAELVADITGCEVVAVAGGTPVFPVVGVVCAPGAGIRVAAHGPRRSAGRGGRDVPGGVAAAGRRAERPIAVVAGGGAQHRGEPAPVDLPGPGGRAGDDQGGPVGSWG